MQKENSEHSEKRIGMEKRLIEINNKQTTTLSSNDFLSVTAFTVSLVSNFVKVLFENKCR